jgi:hypothetical protein
VSIRKFLLWNAVAALVGFAPNLALAAEEVRGWSRAALVARVNELWGPPEVVARVEDWDGRALTLSSSDREACFVGSNDTVWSLPAGPDTVSGHLTSIVMAANGDEVHTVHIWFPIVAGTGEQVDRAFVVLGGIFEHLVPGWLHARAWPLEGLRQTWEIVGKSSERRQPLTREKATVRTSVGAASLAAMGIPPDFVYYRVTLRPECEGPATPAVLGDGA